MLVPVKINKDGGKNRVNVTNLKMQAITHFQNYIESIFTSFLQIYTCYIVPMGIKDEKAKLKCWIQMILLICPINQAVQMVHACLMKARQYVWDTHILGNDKDNKVLHNIFVANDSTLEKHWSKTNHDFTHPFLAARKYSMQKEFNNKTFQDYQRAFKNELNYIIFGVQTYRAITIQTS